VVGSTTFAAPEAVNESPYGVIEGKNVFRLRSPIPETKTRQETPRAKIILEGWATILGRRQVLVRMVFPANPSEPAREISLILDEGEAAGEVEVLGIDERAGTVKVRNRGAEQRLSLRTDTVKSIPGSPLPLTQPGHRFLPAPPVP